MPSFHRFGRAANLPHDEQERTEDETDSKEKHGSLWSMLRAARHLRGVGAFPEEADVWAHNTECQCLGGNRQMLTFSATSALAPG